MQLFWMLIHCKTQFEGVLVHRVGGEQGPCSTCAERSRCPRVPFPMHRDGGKQHVDLGEASPRRKGGRHSAGPAAHPDLPSVAGEWWPLSHRLLGRNRVGCSGPEPALSSSRAHPVLLWREGCDRSGGRKFLLPVLTPLVLRCPCLWQVLFCSFASAAGIVSFQSLCRSPLPSCPPRCSAAGLPSHPSQPPPSPFFFLPVIGVLASSSLTSPQQ